MINFEFSWNKLELFFKILFRYSLELFLKKPFRSKTLYKKKTTANLLIYCTIIIKNNFNYENKLFIIFFASKTF